MPSDFARRDFYCLDLSNRYPVWGIYQRTAFGEGIVMDNQSRKDIENIRCLPFSFYLLSS